jgi:hypothetical protein
LIAGFLGNRNVLGLAYRVFGFSAETVESALSVSACEAGFAS